MRPILTLLGCAVFEISLAATAALGQTAAVDYDHSVNFLNYKSYTVQKVHATNPDVEGRILIALDRDLQARYLHPDSGSPDLVVAAVEANKDAGEYTNFYAGLNGLGWERSWGSGFMDGAPMVGDIKPGTLVLDMWDRRTGKLVWRGAVTEPAAAASSGEADRKFDSAVGQLLAKFPPKFKK